MRFLSQNTIQILSKPNLLRFLKLLFLITVTLILFYQISKLNLSYTYLKQVKDQISLPYLFLGIVLVIPNYYFEIKKWEILGGQLEQRNFSKATVEVLRGLKLGILTPLMLGDYVGRSLDFKKENRGTAVILNLFNSFTQTWTALLLGAMAIFLWYFTAENTLKPYLLLPAILVSASALLGIIFLYGLKTTYFKPIKFLQKYISDFNLPLSLKKKIIGLSLLRSCIYNLQYYFFYKAFSILLPSFVYFIGVNVLLLIKTVGGGLNVFGDLSLRELVSINFFGLYNIDQRLVLIATFVVWFFNVFSPIIFGIFYKARS